MIEKETKLVLGIRVGSWVLLYIYELIAQVTRSESLLFEGSFDLVILGPVNGIARFILLPMMRIDVVNSSLPCPRKEISTSLVAW